MSLRDAAQQADPPQRQPQPEPTSPNSEAVSSPDGQAQKMDVPQPEPLTVRAWTPLDDYREDNIKRCEAALDALKAERDALKVDAERYRWLRDHMWAQSSTKIYALPISWEYSPDVMAGGYMDAAIDAARGE